jgi:hypothetical protein
MSSESILETPASAPRKIKLIQRLRSYWKIACANAFFIPGIAWLIVSRQFKEPVGLPLMLNLIANSWLLVVGTIALRMMYLGALGDRSCEERWLGRLYYAKLPSLLLVCAGVARTIWESFQTLPQITAGWAACLFLTLMAIAEYVNYYHFQLQHFDNFPDFQRLLSGKGFRRSHLSRRLASWNSTREN